MRKTLLNLEELESRNLLSVFTPAQIRHAYGFDQITFDGSKVQADGSGQTIAIVEAFHDPQISADLHYFDRTFGLPDPPRFSQVNQIGGATFPAVSPSWSLETALDVEWAHAIAPKATILLVEASSATFTDLLAAVNYARFQPGVVVVSMSWGSSEFAWETGYDAYFTTPAGHMGGSGLPGGITFVASTGDDGAGTSYPAVSPNVLAVGGTSLVLGQSGNYASEKAWSGSGGGLSLYESKPNYQQGVAGGKRGTPDVSLNGDPYTGYYIYDTVPYSDNSGWFQDAGTSGAAPQWAALIALVDQGRALAGRGSLANAQSFIYSLPAGDFHDIASGSNGISAAPGYDLATGRGTPKVKLVVQDLLSAGTRTVLPRMARSVAATAHSGSNSGPTETSSGLSSRPAGSEESTHSKAFVVTDLFSIQEDHNSDMAIISDAITLRARSVSDGERLWDCAGDPSLTLGALKRNNSFWSAGISIAKTSETDNWFDWLVDPEASVDDLTLNHPRHR
jgi:hypothetical protein